MMDTYIKYLKSKGYTYNRTSNTFSKYGVNFIPRFDNECYWLSRYQNTHNRVYVLSSDQHEFIRTSMLKKLKKAEDIILSFFEREYDERREIEDYSNIPLAYTRYGEDDYLSLCSYGIQVVCDLIDYEIITYADDKEVDTISYPSLDSLIEEELCFLDFDALVSVKDEWCVEEVVFS